MQKKRGELFKVFFENQRLPKKSMDHVYVLGWNTANHVSLLLKLRLHQLLVYGGQKDFFNIKFTNRQKHTYC